MTNRQDTSRSTGGDGTSRTSDHIASKMHETVDRVHETARNAEQEIRSRAADLGESARSRAADLGERAREQEERALKAVEANLQKAKSYVQENPLTSAGIAFVAGVLVSGLLRR